MYRTTEHIKEKQADMSNVKFSYPWYSAILALIILLVSPFTSQTLMYVVFVIQIYRLFKYDVVVNCIDIAFLISFTGLYRAPGGDSLLALFVLLFDLRSLLRIKRMSAFTTIMLMLTSVYLALRLGDKITTLFFMIGGLMFLWILSEAKSVFNNEKILYSFIGGTAVSSIYAWVFTNNEAIKAIVGIDKEKTSIVVVDYTRFSGLFADPNYYSAVLIFALIGIMILRINKKIKPTLGYVIAIIITLIGLLTVSKSFFLMLVVILVYYTFSLFSQKRLAAGTGMLLLLSVLAVLAFSGSLSMLDNVIVRLTTATSKAELTTGRSIIWENYSEYISSHPLIFLFGEGLDAPLLNMVGTHNIFLESIYNIGITGLLLMVTLLISVFKVLSRDYPKRKQPVLRFLPVIAFISLYFFLQGIAIMTTYLILFIMLVCYFQSLTRYEE
ncbi:MAG: O-antigen ligase family protein [Candidatus Ornithospirochaeta sp.]